MQTEEILRIARSAAKTIKLRYEQDWTAQDWEDAVQSGALGVIRGLEYSQNGSYLYRAACDEITRWLFRQRRGQSSVHSISTEQVLEENQNAELAGVEPAGKAWSLNVSSVKQSLYATLYASRKKKGTRGKAATERDVQIILLLSQGYNYEAIANELGISPNLVRKTRQDIRNRLRQIAASRTEE